MVGGECFLIFIVYGEGAKSMGRHIFTGFAGYFNLTRLIWLRYCLDGKQDDFQLAWPSVFTSVPVVVRVENQKRKSK
jgi:dihydroceramidase